MQFKLVWENNDGAPIIIETDSVEELGTSLEYYYNHRSSVNVHYNGEIIGTLQLKYYPMQWKKDVSEVPFAVREFLDPLETLSEKPGPITFFEKTKQDTPKQDTPKQGGFRLDHIEVIENEEVKK